MTYEELAHRILNDFTPEQKSCELTMFVDNNFCPAFLDLYEGDAIEDKQPYFTVRLWQHGLASGDAVYFSDPEVLRSRHLVISEIEWVGPVAKITDEDGNYLECLASELS